MSERQEPWSSFQTTTPTGDEAVVVYDRETYTAWIQAEMTVPVRR